MNSLLYVVSCRGADQESLFDVMYNNNIIEESDIDLINHVPSTLIPQIWCQPDYQI